MATQNKVQKSSDGTSVTHLSDSVIYDDGTNVGIGCTPDTKLSIVASSDTPGTTPPLASSIDLINLTQIANTWSAIQFGSYDGLGNVPMTAAIGGKYTYRNIGVNHALVTSLVFCTGDNFTYPMAERLRIDSGGNVGVGVTSPKGLLQLKSSWVMAPAPLGSNQDDRGAIQDCIDEVYGSGGGTVVLQNGTYTILKTSGQNYGLLMKQGVHLSGVSMHGTKLVPGESGTSSSVPFEVIRLDDGTNGFIVGSIQNLCIDNSTTPKTNITGIHVGNYYYYYDTQKQEDCPVGPQPYLVENVRLLHCDTGIKVGSWFSEIRNCEFRECVTVGIHLHYDYGTSSHDDTNATQVIHCIIMGDPGINPMDKGIIVDGACNQIVDCTIGGFTTYGIEIADSGARANYIAGNYIESTATDAVGIYVQSQGNTIIGNYFDLSHSSSGHEVIISSSGIQMGNTVLGNYSGNTISAPLSNQVFGNLDVEGGIAASGNGVGITLQAQDGAHSGNTDGGKVTINGGAPYGGGINAPVLLQSTGTGSVGIGETGVTNGMKFEVAGNINVSSGSGYRVAADQVVGARQAAVSVQTIYTGEIAGSSYTSNEQTMLTHLKTDVTNLRAALNDLVTKLSSASGHGLLQ